MHPPSSLCGPRGRGRADGNYFWSGSSSHSRHKAQRGPSLLVLGDNEDEGRQREGLIPLLWGGENLSSLGGADRQPVGCSYFTNETSGRVWGSHAPIISLDVPFVCIKSHFASLLLSAPPLATPTRLGITSFTPPSAGCYRILPASQCIFTPPNNHLSHPKPSSTLFLYHYLAKSLAVRSRQGSPRCLTRHEAENCHLRGTWTSPR